MLKQIPRETPSKKIEMKKDLNHRSHRRSKKPLYQNNSFENKIVHVTLMKLFHYLKRSEKYGAGEMEELIHSLQRSVLNLQKKRRDLLHQTKKEKHIHT